MQNMFVDFRAVKAAVGIRTVLDHYGVNWLRNRGDELRGRCPIHKGESEDSFHVNVVKNCFQCFAGSCKKRGNVLDFVAAMERCSVRDAALKLAEWFSVSASTATSSVAPNESRGERQAINQPLGFHLKGVDSRHEYLRARGITEETAVEFGIGYFGGKGSMSARIVIPIHNERGELVAYAGRALDGAEPRYKLPAGFQKSAVLYNLHRVLQGKSREVVIVEGFFDCLRLWQIGLPVVALMGSSLSEQQAELLIENFGVASLCFDGDEAGRKCTDECLVRLGRKMWAKAFVVPEGKQPDSLSEAEARLLFGL